MAKVDDKMSEHEQFLCSLINHLYKKSSLAPVKTGQGNECVIVDMSDCSQDFLLAAENFFVDSKRFQILIRGEDYYVEVLNGDSYADVYIESM